MAKYPPRPQGKSKGETMKKGLIVSTFALLAGAATATADETQVGVSVTEWDSATVAVPGVVVPVGGSGQVNGSFVTAEKHGVQIGLRAQHRFVQNVDPLPVARDPKKVAVYSATTGTSDALGRATWNYDFHIDLRGATGPAKGKTLGDYTVALDTNIGSTLFGQPVPTDLGASTIPAAVLYQNSLNPKFGNPPFEATAEGTYTFTLTLTPATFKGAALSVTMRVVVTNP
jgi:hypothetical protein